MAKCGFNEKMLRGVKDLLDGAVEYGIIERAKNKGISIDEQFKSESREISSFIYNSRNITEKPTQKQIEGIVLLVGGTFGKDKLNILNYPLTHSLDIGLLKDLDDYFYKDLGGNVKNIPKLFDWVNNNLEEYKI